MSEIVEPAETDPIRARLGSLEISVTGGDEGEPEHVARLPIDGSSERLRVDDPGYQQRRRTGENRPRWQPRG